MITDITDIKHRVIAWLLKNPGPQAPEKLFRALGKCDKLHAQVAVLDMLNSRILVADENMRLQKKV